MSMNELFTWTIYILVGFLSGSIMFCKLIPQYVLGIDICSVSPDQNPGAMNVFIHCGRFWGFICLILDILKGYIPIFLAIRHLDPTCQIFSIMMLSPVLGHALAPFNHFHGGKCIATAFGVMLALYPVNQIGILLAVFYIVFSTILKIPDHRLRSMAVFSLFGIVAASILIYRNQNVIAMGCIFISLVAFAKHTMYFSPNRSS